MATETPERSSEKYPNQSSLCASCAHSVRHAFIDSDDVSKTAKLAFFCHSKAISGGSKPAFVTDLVVECEPFVERILLITSER